MDAERLDYLRRQRVNVEELGEIGNILIEKAELGITPIFRKGEAIAMVIEINAFDREWEFKGEPKNQEDDASYEELVRYLDEQNAETGRTTE